jgi:hypothetical protein
MVLWTIINLPLYLPIRLIDTAGIAKKEYIQYLQQKMTAKIHIEDK